ncbi:hypothetical protein HFO33_29580 [Rhizobium leguminosarum]|nr:hypothetical protein [Rhizobium leguminosarum]
MKKQRFTEEQIIGVLNEQEAGADQPLPQGRIFRSNILQLEKSQHGGMKIPWTKRLNALKDEDTGLEKVLERLWHLRQCRVCASSPI